MVGRLNPFRAGRCLSTFEKYNINDDKIVSIPFEQGDVFRQFIILKACREELVSIPFEQGDVFRQISKAVNQAIVLSQSLSSRAMSFDRSGMLEAGIMRLFRPTSQFFWKVKELALDLSK